MNTLRANWSTKRTIGALVVVLAIVALYAVYQKERIATALSFGDTVTARFAQMYKLNPYRNDVKLAGVVVGTVTSEEYDDEAQTSIVTMEIIDGVAEKLGTQPSANLRPTLVLGGKYYIDLEPGGAPGTYDGAEIPVQRTTIPVELDRVLSSLNAEARDGIRASIGQFDATLREGGREALRELVAQAPATLRPAGSVLGALRGTRPDQDLTAVVTGFESAADAFTRTDGQVGRIVESLRDTSAAFAASSPALAEASSIGADTMRATRAGLEDLQPTLRTLTRTAPAFRESARELDDLFDDLEPALDRTRSVVDQLRPLINDLRPATDDFVPTVSRATEAFDDLRGPVLDRINGPIEDLVFASFSGTTPFEHGGANGNLFYEEVGFLFSHLVSTFSVWDRNGAAARLTAGLPAGNTLGGSAFPPSSEMAAETLGAQQPPGPQGAPPAEVAAEPPAGTDTLFPADDSAPSIPRDPAALPAAPAAQPALVPGALGQEGGS